jgi:hypothetical protein
MVLILTFITVSSSHGSIVLRSITSHETFNFSWAKVATSRNTCTCVPYPTNVTSSPEIELTV